MMDWLVFWSHWCLVQNFSDIFLFIHPEDPDCFSLLRLGSGYLTKDHSCDLGQHWCLNQIISLRPPEPTAVSPEVARERLCHFCLSWAELNQTFHDFKLNTIVASVNRVASLHSKSDCSRLVWPPTKSETGNSNVSPWQWPELKDDASQR